MSDIEVEYRDETITYDEYGNVWMWQGARSGLISLTAARASIDRAIDGVKDKPKFKKRKAIFSYYGSDYIEVEVTSRKDNKFWILLQRQGKGKRSCESAENLYADTPENREKIEQQAAKEEERSRLQEEAHAIKASMQSFTDWLKEQDDVEGK